jgi:hypothetical protein
MDLYINAPHVNTKNHLFVNKLNRWAIFGLSGGDLINGPFLYYLGVVVAMIGNYWQVGPEER